MLFCTAFASLQLQASPERGGGPAKLVEGFAATAANRFHKELRFFFSLLKRKKEAKKEKRSKKRKEFAFHLFYKIQVSPEDHVSTKIPRRGIQAAAAAVTLLFSQLKLGRKVSGDPPLSLLKRKKEAKKEKSPRFTCSTRFKYHPKITHYPQ